MTAQSSVASRSTPFGYICRRCSRCCRHKQIQINPYEVARLARAKGQSTSEFRAAWTVDGDGTVLRQNEDGTCVFLGPPGCQVHSDRPQVCRLYPLGRHVRSDGSEYFSQLEGHPLTAGAVCEKLQLDCTTDDVTEASDLLATRGFVMKDEGLYLALAIPQTRNR